MQLNYKLTNVRLKLKDTQQYQLPYAFRNKTNNSIP